MKLFGKKKETKSCCCGENCTSETMQKLLSDKAGEASGYDLQQKVKILKRI